MNIMYVLRSLSKPNVYKALLAVHMLVESFALSDISSPLKTHQLIIR